MLPSWPERQTTAGVDAAAGICQKAEARKAEGVTTFNTLLSSARFG